jgi:hypothetical protein
MFSIIKNLYNNSTNKKSYVKKVKDKKILYKSIFMSNNQLSPLGREFLLDLMEETKLFCNIQNDKDLITREKNRYLLYYILSILYDDYTEIYKELIKEINYE